MAVFENLTFTDIDFWLSGTELLVLVFRSNEGILLLYNIILRPTQVTTSSKSFVYNVHAFKSNQQRRKLIKFIIIVAV